MRKTPMRIIAGAVLVLPSLARALINPRFTPIHLTDQSQTILRLKLAGQDVAGRAEFTVIAAMKGKAPAKVAVDLTKAPKGHGEAAGKQLTAARGETVLLFAGTYEKGKLAYLHAGGRWLRLSGGEGGTWRLEVVDADMEGTWAGGTDMLQRCVQYIIDSRGDATVPVESRTAWRNIVKIGAVNGKVKSLAAVDLDGDGKPCLHVASPAGDKLLRPQAGKEAFEDITAKVKLSARSVACAWGDFNADGRLDLACFDGKTLTLWNRRADGAFAPARAGGELTLGPKCPPLATVGCAAGAAPALVAASAGGTLLLNPIGNNAFKAVRLTPAGAADPKWGAPQAPLVGDFNNDALPDVIQPFETDGLLFAGKRGGAFEPGKPCGVNCTKGGGNAAVGDFDGDGWLDVLSAGAEGVRVFHNRHDGTFAEKMGISGEIAYKAQPFASACGVGDINNDARQDLFIAYSDGMTLLYFNRGFRSFGEAPKLEMALSESQGEEPGQEAGLLCDLDCDGAEDFVIVRPNGEIWCAYNDLGGEGMAIKVRLPTKAPFAGPVRVTAWREKRCLGAFQVRAGAVATLIGIEEAGPYVLKWRFPTGPPRQRKVVVEDGAAGVLLSQPGEGPAR